MVNNLILLLAALLLLSLAAAEAQPISSIIMLKDYSFQPNSETVTAGSEVTWKNADAFNHTVAFDDGITHLLKPGESFSRIFTEPGSYRFRYPCILEASGEIRVTPMVTDRQG